MTNISFQDVLSLLGIGTGQAIIWSIFLYLIFFFALLALFLTPNKNMIPTLLVAATMLFAIVGKLSVAANAQHRTPIIGNKDFGMFVINAGMLVFPLIAVGMTRARKRPSTVPAIFASLTAGIYFFLFWLIAQH